MLGGGKTVAARWTRNRLGCGGHFGKGPIRPISGGEGHVGAIRTAARALIFRGGRLLLARCRDADGDWYMAPGGGQHEGESLPETLVRECREELGAEGEVLGLCFVRDYIVARHAFSYLDEAAHQLEVFFECRVSEDYQAGLGDEPDSRQIGVVWADHAMLAGARVYPAHLKRLVSAEGRSDLPLSDLPLYWGEDDRGQGD